MDEHWDDKERGKNENLVNDWIIVESAEVNVDDDK